MFCYFVTHLTFNKSCVTLEDYIPVDCETAVQQVKHPRRQKVPVTSLQCNIHFPFGAVLKVFTAVRRTVPIQRTQRMCKFSSFIYLFY